MCLHVTSDKAIAENDIVCYKVVMRNCWSNITRTLMRETVLEEDVLKGKQYHLPEIERNPIMPKVIDEGFVHAYTDLYSATYMHYLHCTSDPCRVVEIYKCIIPKGTEYYEGFDNGHAHLWCAAAKKLQFVSKVKVTYHDQEVARKKVFDMAHNKMFSSATGNK